MKHKHRLWVLLASVLITEQASAETSVIPEPTLDPAKVRVGERIFHDATLSDPAGQSCASCHSPSRAFADPAGAIISPGAGAKFGNRNAPSVIYSMYTPPFGFIDYSQKWAGGQFWDGRAQTLQEQAEGPFFNPLEMNNTEAGLAVKLAGSAYKDELTETYGDDIWRDPKQLVAAATDALAQFQSSDRLAQRFTSKFDLWREKDIPLSDQETKGMMVFQDKGKCMNCHPVFGSNGPILFSDFTYHNIGVPKNLASPFLGMDASINPDGKAYVDTGLALNPNVPKEQLEALRGRFRTPSLRNVA